MYPLDTSLEAQNRFSLEGKTPGQYGVLALGVAAVLLTLYALTVCARSKLSGRKWPWIVFILVGFGRVAVNWTTAAWQWSPLAVQLCSFCAAASFYGPWIVSTCAPVGAIVFLLRRPSLLAPSDR